MVRSVLLLLGYSPHNSEHIRTNEISTKAAIALVSMGFLPDSRIENGEASETGTTFFPHRKYRKKNVFTVFIVNGNMVLPMPPSRPIVSSALMRCAYLWFFLHCRLHTADDELLMPDLMSNGLLVHEKRMLSICAHGFSPTHLWVTYSTWNADYHWDAFYSHRLDAAFSDVFIWIKYIVAKQLFKSDDTYLCFMWYSAFHGAHANAIEIETSLF